MYLLQFYLKIVRNLEWIKLYYISFEIVIKTKSVWERALHTRSIQCRAPCHKGCQKRNFRTAFAKWHARRAGHRQSTSELRSLATATSASTSASRRVTREWMLPSRRRNEADVLHSALLAHAFFIISSDPPRCCHTGHLLACEKKRFKFLVTNSRHEPASRHSVQLH